MNEHTRGPVSWILFLTGILVGLSLLYFILDSYWYFFFSKSPTRYEVLMVPALAGVASFPVWCMASLGAKLLEGILHRLVVVGIYGVTWVSLLHAAFCFSL